MQQKRVKNLFITTKKDISKNNKNKIKNGSPIEIQSVINFVLCNNHFD